MLSASFCIDSAILDTSLITLIRMPFFCRFHISRRFSWHRTSLHNNPFFRRVRIFRRLRWDNIALSDWPLRRSPRIFRNFGWQEIALFNCLFFVSIAHFAVMDELRALPITYFAVSSVYSVIINHATYLFNKPSPRILRIFKHCLLPSYFIQRATSPYSPCIFLSSSLRLTCIHQAITPYFPYIQQCFMSFALNVPFDTLLYVL